MDVQAHLLSGWCIANLLELTPRERALAMVAASVADADGLGLLVNINYYVEYHHVLGHNILFGLLLSTVLTAFCSHRLKAFVLFFGLFHLHLLLDCFGSGVGWSIPYFWPVEWPAFRSPYAWPLGSWQNFLAIFVLYCWAVGIAIYRHRTPFEAIVPSLDARIVQRLRQPR